MTNDFGFNASMMFDDYMVACSLFTRLSFDGIRLREKKNSEQNELGNLHSMCPGLRRSFSIPRIKITSSFIVVFYYLAAVFHLRPYFIRYSRHVMMSRVGIT